MELNLKQIGVVGEIKKININHMVSSAGKDVPNQYNVFIYSEDGIYNCFYSYDKLIIVIKNGKIIKVGKDYNYSNTTGKYRNIFTGLNLKELDKYIKDMSYNCDNECWELRG
jgi:hypothetical protein